MFKNIFKKLTCTHEWELWRTVGRRYMISDTIRGVVGSRLIKECVICGKLGNPTKQERAEYPAVFEEEEEI